ncbi:MAG TPA: hypothetical protein VGM39_11315 [Kofleriaceae bacterium]
MRLFLIALALVAGCMPYAIPPASVDLGATRSTEDGSRTGLHVDVGLSPMQVMPTQVDRRWDAVLLGSFDRMGTRDSWGGALAVGPTFFPMPVTDPDSRLRLLPQVIGRLTTEASSVGARVVLEYATFTNGTGKDGYAYGEAAIGGYLEGSYRSDDELVMTIGLTVRVPILAGVACCFK